MAFRRRLVTLAGGLLLVASMAAPPVAAHVSSPPTSAPPPAYDDGDGVLQVPDALTGSANSDGAEHVSTIDRLRGSAVLDPVQALLGGGPSKPAKSTKEEQTGKAGSDQPFGPQLNPLASAASDRSTPAKPAAIQQNPDHPTMTPQLAAATESRIAASMNAMNAALLRARTASKARTSAGGTAAPNATYTISGRVTAPGGAGVAGVAVSTLDGTATTATAAGGTYSLSVAAGTYQLAINPADTYAAGYYSTSGFVYNPYDASDILVSGSVTVDVTLQPLRQITGTVTNAGGTPIGNVMVNAEPEQWDGYAGQAFTAPDGTYTIEVPAGMYQISFVDFGGTYAQGYYSAAGSSLVGRLSATPIVVSSAAISGISPKMDPARLLQGTVRETGGTPIGGITVIAISADDVAYASTDSSGLYTFHLRPGTYTIQFTDNSHTYVTGYYSTGGFVTDSAAATSVKLTTSNVTGADVRLPRYLVLSGRIIAAGTTNGIAGVYVSASGTASGDWAESDATGAYELSLEPGSYLLTIEDDNSDYADGYYSNGVAVKDRSKATLIALSADRSGVDVRLSMLPHISGKVTAVGAMHPVQIRISGSDTRSKLSAADGTYSIGVNPGMYVIRVADPLATYSGGYYSAGGFTPKRSGATVVTVTTSNVTGKNVKLPAAPKLKGKVTTPAGAGIGGVGVVAMGADDVFQGVSAADGTFAVPVSIGSYTLSFEPDPSTDLVGGWYSASGLTLDDLDAMPITAAADVSGLNVRLIQGREIHGRALGQGGAPASAQVIATSGLFSSTTDTAGDGTFTLVVPAGSYIVLARFDTAGYANVFYAGAGSSLDSGSAATLVVGSSNLTGIDVRLPATHKLGGTLLDSAGTPIVGEMVFAEPSGGGYVMTTTGGTGSFALDLLPGDYKISIDTGVAGWSYSFGSFDRPGNGSPVTVAGADVSLGSLRLPQTRQFSGKFSGGLTATGDVPSLMLVGNTAMYSARASTDGRFTVSVPSGTYVAYVYSGEGTGYYAPGKLLDTPEGATVYTIGTSNVTGLTLSLPAATHISGKVATAAGSALPGVEVRGESNGAYLSTVTAADGSFRLPILAGATTLIYVDEPLGEYTSGYYAGTGFVLDSRDATPITVTTAERTGVNVKLPSNRHISGTIVSAAGKPVSDQNVAADSDDYTAGDATAYDGTFRLAVPDGSYEIYLREIASGISGYRKGSTVTFDSYDATRTAVTGADVAAVNTTLPAFTKVSGRVTRSGGAGILGVAVVGFSTVASAYTYSAVDGSYTLRLPAGNYGLEFADDAGRYARAYYSTGGAVSSQPGASAVAVATTPRTGLNVQLGAARHVSGTITGGGRGLAGYEVDFYSTGLPQYAYSTRVHGDGSYSIEVPAGTYLVHVAQSSDSARLGTYIGGYLTASGGVTADTDAARIVTVSSADVSGVNATVPAAPTVRGKVTLPSGAPAANARLWVESEMYAAAGTAGIDGTYSVAVPAGAYTVEFSDGSERYFSGYYTTAGLNPRPAAAATVAVGASGASGINGRFVASATISGRLTTNGMWGTITARSADGVVSQATMTGGDYAVPVPPGTYTLQFQFEHWEWLDRALDGYYAASGIAAVSSAAKSIVVGGANVKLATVTDPDGQYLSGHVVGENGLPLLNTLVEYLGTKQGYAGTTQTDIRGLYGLAIPADGYLLSFTDYGFGYASGYLGPNTTTRYTADYGSAARQAVSTTDVSGVNVTLPTAKSIGGTVTSPSGAKVSNIVAEAVLPSGYPALGAAGVTGADGKYSIAAAPGTYTIHFADPSKVYANGWYSTSGFKTAKASASPVTVSANVTGINVKLVLGVGGATFVSLTPNRLVDTRSKLGLSAKLSANHHATFQVTGRATGDAARDVPANAVAVTGNLTVANQTAGGFLALTPIASDAPATSTLNFPLGDIRANAITVPLGAGGKLNVTYVAHSGAAADVVFDVTGYFVAGTTGATYKAVTPTRLVDSRSGLGIAGKLKAGQHATFHVVDRAAGDRDRNIPSTAIAVTGNLTVVNQTAKGYLSLTPQPADAPTTSTLNFPLGDIRANAVTVPINGDGTLSVTYAAPSGAAADVVFDVSGYFEPGTDGAVYVPLTPNRLVDSRIDVGLTAPLAANVPATFRATDRASGVAGKNVPSNAVGVTGNLTVVYPTAKGYLALTTTPQAKPTTSTLNFPVRDIRANAVTATLGANGALSVTYAAVAGSRADVVFDVTGCFVN